MGLWYDNNFCILMWNRDYETSLDKMEAGYEWIDENFFQL